jgi:hypothetical protein
MLPFPDYREYFLTTEDLSAVTQPFADHGHCFGFISEQAIDLEKRFRAQKANEKCEQSPTRKHRWCGGKCLHCPLEHPEKLGSHEECPPDGH